METKKSEDFLTRITEKNITILIIVILSIYIYYSKNTQTFLIDGETDLRSKNTLLETDLNLSNNVRDKLISGLHLMNKDYSEFNRVLPTNELKFVSVIENRDHHHNADNNMHRVITAITTEYDIKYYIFYSNSEDDSNSEDNSRLDEFYKEIAVQDFHKITNNTAMLLETPTLFLISKRDKILASFTFTGKENSGERGYIGELLSSLIKEYNQF
ncbi:hypothetical protein IID62_02210 [candidate division KSB1 bacterium]|nr:hypothetical protein [candidate division KSB1 bacterium]